jgi:chromosome segregation ATPase
MPLDIQCPKCGAKGQIPAAPQPGCKLGCPQCKAMFTLSGSAIGSSQHLDSLEVHGAWVDPPIRVPAEVYQTPVEPSYGFQPGTPPTGPLSERDAANGLDWIRGEAERFQRYVGQQFAKIRAARHSLAELESDAEKKILGREMEHNRLQTSLVARQEELDRACEALKERETETACWEQQLNDRESELAEREATLNDDRVCEAITVREAELAKLEERIGLQESEFYTQEAKRAALKAEIVELGRQAAELRPMVERLKHRKAEAEAGRASLTAAEAALERRMIEVRQAEMFVQNRLDEIDELEQNLRSELEIREQDLERQRVMVEEQAKAVRGRIGVSDPTPLPMVWQEMK